MFNLSIWLYLHAEVLLRDCKPLSHFGNRCGLCSICSQNADESGVGSSSEWRRFRPDS